MIQRCQQGERPYDMPILFNQTWVSPKIARDKFNETRI